MDYFRVQMVSSQPDSKTCPEFVWLVIVLHNLLLTPPATRCDIKLI